jgi:hypothetical protein
MGNVLDLLEKTELNLEARNKAWRELIVAVGDDASVQPEHVKAVLRDVGKTVADLKTAVELYNRRKAHAATIQAYREKESERPEIDRQYNKALEKLGKAKLDFHAVTDPLTWKIEAINDARRAALDAERELRSTCPDELVSRRLREIDAKRISLSRQMTPLQDRIHRLEYELSRDAADSALRTMSPIAMGKAVAGVREQLARTRAELADLHQKGEQLAAEAAELDAQRLIP